MKGGADGFSYLDLFYRSTLGKAAASFLNGHLHHLFPGLPEKKRKILVIGYGLPLVPFFGSSADYLLTAESFEKPHPSRTKTFKKYPLPYPDGAYDYVFLLHSLEMAEPVESLLQETFRVLKDDGKIVCFAPNRRGFWATSDASPFGIGKPYTMKQLETLLTKSLFTPLRKTTALLFPPCFYRLGFLNLAKWGRFVDPYIRISGGVLIMEAEKQIFKLIGSPHPSAQTASRVYAPFGYARELSRRF